MRGFFIAQSIINKNALISKGIFINKISYLLIILQRAQRLLLKLLR